jgi:tetratricopeptide (TPR) repeat protein
VVKKISALGLLALGLAACVTLTPPRPSLRVEAPSPDATAGLSLDDRIAVADAWDSLRQGDLEKAKKTLAALGIQNPFCYAGLGYAALIVDDLRGAEAYFLQSVRDFPELALSHIGLGQIYQRTGQPDLAYNEYLEALKRDPENEWARRETDAYRTDQADRLLSEGRAQIATGNLAKAMDAYLQALEYAPKAKEAHFTLAKIYLQEKNYQGALFHLKTAIANDPNDKQILIDYADALFLAGQQSRSLDAYQRVLELDPQNKTARDRAESLKGRLGVVELPSQFGGIPALDAVTKEDVAALIGVKFKDTLEESAPKPQVIVDITTSWANRYIVKVASLALMEVYSNHTFQPRKLLTRAELAETLVRLVDFLKKQNYRIIEQIPIDRIKVADVPQEHVYYPPIAQVLAYQLMELSPDRTFRPEQPVSGAEAVRIFDLLLGVIK